MSKKNKPDSRGIVFSTDPHFKFEQEQNHIHTLPPAQQKLRVWLETKYRGGKAATVITGFIGLATDMEALGKKLKTYCGTGGSAKDNEIIVQGDQREKVLNWLLKNGYTQTKKAGA